MKTYELTYIISPEITSEEAEAKSKEVASAIIGKEGVVVMQSNPSAKTLSYPIKKSASGFFGVLEFQLEPEKMLEVEKMLDKDSKIVRHMVLIKKPIKIVKQRRTRPAAKEMPVSVGEKEETVKQTKKEEKPKVELKDIEQTLDEILGE